MSEYWKSTPKYWCKHCKIFVRDTKLETANHNASPKHQGNLKRFLRDLQRNHERDEKEKERAKSEVARLNGVVSRTNSQVKLSSKNGGYRESHYSSTSATSTVSESQRKQNLAQLAEMGISIPNELRPEIALPGEWQVISERIIHPTDSDKEPDATVTSARKRLLDENQKDSEGQEEAFQSSKKKWRYSSRRQRNEGDDNEIDVLLKNITQSKKQTIKSEIGNDDSQETKDIDQSPKMHKKKQHNDFVVVKSEPCESRNLLLKSLDKEILEKSDHPNMLFKKRKAKNIRQK